MKTTYKKSATRLAALSYAIPYAFYLLSTVHPDILALPIYIVSDILFAYYKYVTS